MESYTTVLCVKAWRCGLRIGGYPGKYNPAIKRRWLQIHPNYLFGHSHILKVMFDKKYDLLHMNLARKKWFHQVRTMLRFVIEGDKIKDLEIIEIEKA
jgi:hypothetical protein